MAAKCRRAPCFCRSARTPSSLGGLEPGGFGFGFESFPGLGPPVVPFHPFLGEGSPTKIDYRKSWCPYSKLSTGGPSGCRGLMGRCGDRNHESNPPRGRLRVDGGEQGMVLADAVGSCIWSREKLKIINLPLACSILTFRVGGSRLTLTSIGFR